MIKFRCAHCQQKLGVPDEYAGRRIRCSKCGQPGVVPKPAAVSEIPQAKTPPLPPRASVVESVQNPLASSTEVLDEFEELSNERNDSEDQSRQAAIRLAAKERLKRTAKADGQPKSNRSASERTQTDDSGGLSLMDKIPDVLRLPLGLVLSVAAVGVTILIWITCSRATENALCFAALFVPLAGALALRLFVVERTLLLGIAAVAIGGLGIAAGKAAIARYVVIPYYHQKAEEVVLADLKKILADPRAQLPESQSANFIVKDGDFMMCIALASLVEDGQLEPAEAGSRAVKILRASNKLNVVDFFNTVTSGGQSTVISKPGEDEDVIMSRAYDRMIEWTDQEQELQMARKYYPVFSRLAQQADIQRLLEDPKLTWHAALLNTLGLLDLVWIMLGLGLGYIMASYD